MLPELDRAVDEQKKKILVQIDDYTETIYAILGFASLWLYDAAMHQNRDYVKVFQGRRLTPVPDDASMVQSQNDVFPDLGIVIEDKCGILGEVKKNFPKGDEDRGQKIFAQMKSYDQGLVGWPTEDKNLQSHELVLLVHQTTSRSAQDLYTREVAQGNLHFDRPFSIVQFNRSDQRVPYFFFTLVNGKVDCVEGNVDLHNGEQVPMQALLHLYSETKLYDAEPPVAYLLHLIWEHVLTPIASEHPKFGRLRRAQRLEITVTIDEILRVLHEGFSFYHWHTQHVDRQRTVPRREWVQRACDFLVQSEEAKWVKDKENSELLVYYQKYEDMKEHFVELQAKSESARILQPRLPFDSA